MSGLNQLVNIARKIIRTLSWVFSILLLFTSGCLQRSGEEGSAGLKVFLALGICLAAVFIVFFIVVKGREKD